MMKFVETHEGVNIIYNDEIIFSHTKSKPSFYLGQGYEKIESYRGNFKIEDFIEQRIGLDSYQVFSDKVRFFHYDIYLDMSIEEKQGRLVIGLKTSPGYNRFWTRVYAVEDEKIYGCGEQASYFNLRGRNFPLWTSEPGVGRDKNTLTTFYADLHDKAGGNYYNTYYPEPTFVSTRKYWLHADTFVYSEFNFKFKDFHELFFWETPKEIIISFEDSMLNLVHDLTNFTGRPPILPEYLLDGMILGVQGGMDKVMGYLDLAEKHEVLVSGLWCQDWAGYKYTTFGRRLFWNWKLNEEIYPKLPEKIIELEKKNVAFLSYVCPFLLEDQSLFNEANSQGFLALDKNNKSYLVDFGEFYCGIVDLTNPSAFKWFKNIIKTNLIDLGIKGWMADFGEYLPIDCVLFNGVDAKEMHNQWPVLWAQCNYEAVEESGKLGEVFYFMRSGAHGSQHYATSLWAGDQSVNWELHDGIASVIPSALSIGIIGNPFTHSDIGGYTSLHGNIRTKELFDRWLEMSVFTSYMRTHEGNRPTQNFQFYNDENTLDLMSRMTKIRVALKPYIKELFVEGHELGYPVQRPLFMHYEDDQLTYDIQYSYLFGKDILVKPVVHEHQIVQEVYLPDDQWVHLWTGKQFNGKQIVEVECEIGYPPVFYRLDSKYQQLFIAITNKFKKGGIIT